MSEYAPRKIDFTGEHDFLSNFYPSQIKFHMFGIEHFGPSAEHVFQAAKTLTMADRTEALASMIRILSAPSPGAAKRLGRSLQIDVEHWESVCEHMMLTTVRLKFEQHPDLRERLAATAPHLLVERNTWGDTKWGVSARTGRGANLLGEILMHLRDKVL